MPGRSTRSLDVTMNRRAKVAGFALGGLAVVIAVCWLWSELTYANICASAGGHIEGNLCIGAHEYVPEHRSFWSFVGLFIVVPIAVTGSVWLVERAIHKWWHG